MSVPQPGLAAFDRQATSPASFDRRAIPPAASESRWIAPDGYAVRRIDWPGKGRGDGDHPDSQPRGSLLFLPGRGESYEKYLETLDRWHALGWRVTAADWRGQAGSGRLGRDAVTGHVDDFAIWVDDLAALWGQWREQTPAPHVIAGHSMGGHLVLRAVAERRIAPDAVVLSAPMLGLHPRLLPAAVLHPVAQVIARLGDPRRPAWKWGEKPGAFPADRSDLLTHDAARYADEAWWRAARPELVMGPGSWRWIERSLASIRLLDRPGMLEAINIPVLMLATRADRLVDYGAIDRAARRLPRGEMIRFGPEARHEILREADAVRDVALAGIDAFLYRVAPPRLGAGHEETEIGQA